MEKSLAWSFKDQVHAKAEIALTLGDISEIQNFILRCECGIVGGLDLGIPAVRMAGCCPLVSVLSRLRWRMWHWVAASL